MRKKDTNAMLFSCLFGAHCNKIIKKKYKTRSKRKKLHQSKYNLMIKSEEVKYKTDDEEMGESMR